MTVSRVIPFLLCVTLWSFMVDSRCTNGMKYDRTLMKMRFKSWTEQHNKHYEDKDEWMLRLGIYQSNLNFIEFINSQNLSYQLGDNEFADLTNDEFMALYAGRLNFLKPTSGGENSTVSINLKAPPAEVDWRKKGAVNAIKNQGSCGSCWAFSTAAAIEGANQIKTKKLVSLSEQELMDCDTKGQNKGCNGGLMEEAFKFVQSNKGISTEKDYPYTGKQGPCKKTPAKAVLISGFKTIKPSAEDELMAAVAQQPVSAALESKGSPFQLYKSGIFKGECGTKLDHAVNLVGYGAEGANKFWIMRNSWGTTWGEQGYMRLQRGGKPQGTCGVAMQASYPVAA